ncbi:MAG: tRNA lysidine(34) synthetase TilS [Epulopiscium sp.]|nr:tRNA lysidine(34) synthetase TilS [Candidatus Epulonipiscium sp.]
MKKTVVNYIKENKLIEQGESIVVGVSGGADSICLLHILKELRDKYEIQLIVAHINHGMRLEAKEDASFVRSICREWDIPYEEHNCNIVELSRKHKTSEEVVGRNERYNFFEETRLKYSADKIAVAHTMNDQAETMLMRLIRGSGVTGLGAIMAKRDFIIRPLLMISREQVEEYCKQNALDYREDSTNKMDIYTRNKLRLKVLPILKEDFNPNVIEVISQAADQLQETEDYLDIQTKEAYKKVVKKDQKGHGIHIKSFLSYHPVIQSRIIRMVIESNLGSLKDIKYKNINDIMELAHKQSGKSINIGMESIAIREHDHIRILEDKKTLSYSQELNIGINKVVECNKKVEMILVDDSKNKQRYENTYTKNIDYDKINGNLQIRNRKAGDKILLKNGSKKLKDFFIDEKIPKTYRDDVILIADDENVIWIVGYRLSEYYYITDETKCILQIQITDL